MTTPKAVLRPIVTYPPEAVLDVDYVAQALGVSVSTVDRSDLPCFYLGAHKRRYLWGAVIDALRKRSA